MIPLGSALEVFTLNATGRNLAVCMICCLVLYWFRGRR